MKQIKPVKNSSIKTSGMKKLRVEDLKKLMGGTDSSTSSDEWTQISNGRKYPQKKAGSTQ